MSKKILSVLLVAMLIISTMAFAAVSASAAVTSGGTIYLEVPASWKTYTTVYCHLWTDGGDDLYAWQTKKEKAVKVSDGLYSYEIPAGANVNMVIWSNDIGMQTYDLTMGDVCIGDTVYSKNEIVENPVDSEKTCELVYWKTHTEYGPKYQESSIGTTIGVTPDPEKVVPVTTDASNGDAAANNGGSTTTTTGTAANATATTGKDTTTTGDATTVAVIASVLFAGLVVAYVSKKRVME